MNEKVGFGIESVFLQTKFKVEKYETTELNRSFPSSPRTPKSYVSFSFFPSLSPATQTLKQQNQTLERK